MNRQPSNYFREFITLYGISLIALLLVFCFLLMTPEGRLSLTLPDQNYQHPWNGSDIMGYVDPARNFVETGTFGRQPGIPDLHRTVGYPAFLASMMFLFSDNWLKAGYLAQIAIFALLFPCNIILFRALFPDYANSRANISISFLLLFLGIGTAYTGFLLSDQIFTSVLYVGLALGALAIKRMSWIYAILHVLLIAYAAQVRPTLGLFFIADFFLLLCIAFQAEKQISSKVKIIIVFCTLSAAISGSAPAIRNYIHHGIFTPSSVLSTNLARYLAGPVLIAQGNAQEYEDILVLFEQTSGAHKVKIQKEFAIQVIKEYPLESAKRIIYYGIWNFFEPHWQYVMNVFGNGFFLNEFISEDGGLNTRIYKGLPFWLFYGSVYILTMIFLFRRLRNKDWMLLCALSFFALPFLASLINGQGARMRLYVEPLLIDVAAIEVMRLSMLLKR